MAGFSLIKIFTDTNILHASQAHLLVASKVAEYISEHKRIESVDLKWLIPKMVIEERRHQMIQAALELSPKIEALEKLLGHSLAIGKEVIEDRIDSKIRRTIESLGVEVCELDSKIINWDEIINRSAKRYAPFEVSGDKEKGFRDVVIAETFLQELSKSPSTPRSCLLVLVSGDQRLKEYIQEKTAVSKNVRVLDSLDELKSLLNAISSEITEDFLASISLKAKETFWNFETKEGLYGKSEVIKEITERYGDKINEIIENYPGCKRRSSGVTLGDQTFIRKSGQTVVWSRLVILKYDIIKVAPGILSSLFASSAGGQISLQGEEQIVQRVESSFAVEWQHQITTKGNISKPKVNSIDFIGHVFLSNDK